MKLSNLLLTLFAGAGLMLPADEQAGGTERPVSAREIEQLNLQISDATRSSVEAIGEYHTETGDLNNRLDFLRYGGRINYRHGSGTVLYFRGLETSYRTLGNVLNENGLNLTGGVKLSLSESVTAQLEGGATRFSTNGTTVNALGSLRRESGASAIYVTGSRSNVEETLLSAVGIRPLSGTYAGRLVGQVMDNRGVAGARYKFTERFDVFAEGGLGARDGKNIESNFFRVANGGAGFNLLARGDDEPLGLVRASYGLDYFGFDKDLSGFGAASIGRPALSAGGMGGYFSPQAFVSNVGRFELRGRPHPALEYQVGGFIGSQDYTGSRLRQARGVSLSATLHLGDRFAVPVTYLKDNFGPFTQQSLFFRLVAHL